MAKRPQKKTRSPEVSQAKVAEMEKIVSGQGSGVHQAPILQALVMAAAVLWIYWPALHGDWLWDDEGLVSDNAVVRDPWGLWKIWFAPGSLLDYQPLKVSVVWLQWQLWGNHTLGYHLTNVFLHIMAALLVWRLLSKFGLRLAWLGGLIFAIHPVQVESVAWIAELKNTLSLPPFLLAMCFWIDYEEHGKKRDYYLALGLFLAAMLCKPNMVMFPVVILVYDWWKRGRTGLNEVKACLPFFVVSLALGMMTLWFLHHHAIGDEPVQMGGFISRLACGGLTIAFYFSKCFLPVGLLPIYPHWVVDPPTLAQFLPWPILLAVIFWFWTKRRSWGRHALLGLGFFLINLAPFLGFNAASYMAFTWVMDHVLYLPIIGLIGLTVTALGQMEILLPPSFRPCGIGLVMVVLACLVFQSRNYAKLFLNSETLWTYELRHNPDAYPAYLGLGNALLQTGRGSEALEQFELGVGINPDNAEAHYNLATALQQTGQTAESIEQYRQALRIKPNYAKARYNLATALQQTGQIAESIEQYRQALRIKPDYAEAHYNLGSVLAPMGRLPEAIEQFEEALRIEPDNADAHYNLGIALQKTGHVSQALEQFEETLRIKPDFAEAHNKLGTALGQMGRVPEASEQFEQALQIKPDDAEAHNNLGYALEQSGQLAEAIDQYQQALRLKPDLAVARNNLARLQAQQKNAPANK